MGRRSTTAKRIRRNFRLTVEANDALMKVALDLGLTGHGALFQLIEDGYKVHRARRAGGRVVEEVGGVRTEI